MTLLHVTELELASDMTELEAREAVEDIKRGINTVRARIYDLDRRKGWKALGYRSFTACCINKCVRIQHSAARASLTTS